MRFLALVVLAVLAGCGGSANQGEVDARLEALEARVDRLEGLGGTAELGTGKDRPKRGKGRGQLSGGAAGGAAGDTTTVVGAPLPEGEDGAKILFREARRYARSLQVDKALERLSMLQEKFSETETAKRAGRLRRDLKTIGTPVAGLNVTTWFQGDGSGVDISKGKTIVLFGDVTQEDTDGQFKQFAGFVSDFSESFTVVTLLRGGEEINETQAKTFVSTYGIQPPVGKLNKRVKDSFGVRGTPAAAVVSDGTVTWKGMLNELDENVLERLK